MLTLLTIAAIVVAWRIGRAAAAGLRQLPRRNEDMVLF